MRITSDFIVVSAELIQAFQEMHQSRIHKYFEQQDWESISWKINSPFASNMGRVWEQQIWSDRAILSSLLKINGGSLTDELLQTLLVEVEAIVNSCLLTTETINDVTSLVGQSPVTLLTMKWRKEVLLGLQTRTKWNDPTGNCRVGNIVPLKNEAEWTQWAMIKIVATTRDEYEVVD